MKMGELKNYLNTEVKIKIDRQMGTQHPKWGFVYMVNYGFVPGTMAADGEEIDAYLLGEFKPVEEYTGKCIAIIHRTNDDDDKLVIVPEGVNYTDDQIKALTEFQERFFESIIIRE
jgi:inorganic pyrophosphatase